MMSHDRSQDSLACMMRAGSASGSSNTKKVHGKFRKAGQTAMAHAKKKIWTGVISIRLMTTSCVMIEADLFL